LVAVAGQLGRGSKGTTRTTGSCSSPIGIQALKSLKIGV